MPNDLAMRLVATPTLQIANVSMGNVDLLPKIHRETVSYLQSVPHRRVLAATGKAMKDGSFPIANVADLRRAIQAYGRAKNKPKAKRWIMRRARELKRPDLLPEAWGARTANATKVITADMAGIVAGEGDQQDPTPQQNGVMVAIYPTPEVAQALAGQNPNDEPVDQLHVTLAYLGMDDEFDQDQLSLAEKVLSSLPTRTRTMEAQVQGVGTFIADDGNNPQWYSVDCVGLAELRTDVVLALEAVDIEPRVDHDFTPHMTIRYGSPPLPEEIPPGGDVKWPVGAISFVVGNSRIDLTLTTPPATPMEEPADNPTEAAVMPDTEFVAAPGPCSLDRSAKHNWVEDVGGLPNYVCQVARAVARGGRSLDSAIPIAIGTMKNWAHGKGNVSAEVRARAAAALAEWEEKRAKAKAMPNKTHSVEDLELSVEDTTEIELFTSTLNPELSVLDLEEGFAMTAPTVPAHKPAPPAPGAPGKGGEGDTKVADIQIGDVVTNGDITGQVTDIGAQDGVPFITVDAGDAGEVQLWPEGKPDGTPPDVVKKVEAGSGTPGGAPKAPPGGPPKAGKPFAADDPEVITAAGWKDDFEYFWDRASGRTFRVLGDVVQSFTGTDGEHGEWGADTRAAMEVRKLPSVTVQETLHALVAAAVAEAPTRDAVAPEAGRQFRIPVVIPEGVWSGDRRRFSQGSLEAKEPPMPLLWQKETDEGHKRSVTVGKITSVDKLEGGGLGNAVGVFDTHPDAVEAARQVREKFLTGVSGDVDQFDHELSQDESGRESLEINHARLVAATLVAKPAFQEASIEMIPESGEEPVIVASAGPLFPPMAWFENPKLDGPTMLTVTDDGRVYGHIAEWNTPHTANPRLRPPRNRSGYRYFNRKPVRTQEGEDVRVGNLTLVGGHADLSLDPDRTSSHYDDTRSAVADVHVGEDEFGIWCAGAMRSDVTPEQIRAFRASEPSGDWRERDGQLELLAVCQVNSAGFPVQPRALVASSGEVVALVAAGMVGHDAPSIERRVDELSSLVNELVSERDARRRTEMHARIIGELKV